MAQVTTRFSTTGMHCSSCAMLIDMTLGDLDGVFETRTDHATGETVVTYDDAAVTVDDIIGGIIGVGYEAEVAG